jgi:antitoxin MazE
MFMGSGVKTRTVQIGNSRGIRIPKLLLDQANLGNEIEMEVQGDKLIIRAPHTPRQDWDIQFEKMAELGDDKTLDSGALSTSSWDKNEWEWE